MPLRRLGPNGHTRDRLSPERIRRARLLSFEQWLDAFLDRTKREHGEVAIGARKDYFNCYHPSNYQSRAFVCGTQYCHGIQPLFNSTAPPEMVPDPFLVMKNYWAFDWVAIVEFYHASKCLLMARLEPKTPHGATAQRYVQDECWCNDTVAARRNETHVVHHAEGHRDSMTTLPPSILRKIDVLTTSDAALYSAAIKVFLGEVRWLEERLGRRVLCDPELARADRELSYLFPSVSALYRAAPDVSGP